MIRLTSGLCVVLFMACQSGVSLETDRSAYALSSQGVEVSLKVENHSASEFTSPLCAARLERSSEGPWATVSPAAEPVCIASAQRVRPNTEAVRIMFIDPGVRAGTYRFVATVDVSNSGSNEEIPTDSFELTGPGDQVP